MKVKLDDMHSPCANCFIKGMIYDPDSTYCQSCEYNIAIESIHSILTMIGGSNCAYCSHYNGCAVQIGDECKWSIDWDAVVKNFNVGK